MKGSSPRLIIPDWVPPAARRMIEDLWQDPSLKETDRAALIRLATHPTMHADVWDKLPNEPEKLAEDVIWWAIFALGIFSTLRPQLRKRAVWQKWAEHWLMIDWSRRRSASELVWETCAALATQLANALDATNDETWSRHWRGDPVMRNRMNVARFFLSAANCFQSINAEDKSAEANLPPVARWDDPQAHERFFSEFVSQNLHARCGRYCDPVVDALTAVAFDLPSGRGPEAVRGRRRMATGKIKPKKRG